MIKWRWGLPSGNLLIAGLVFLSMGNTYADDVKWIITSTAQTTQGKYIYNSNSQTNYLSMGIAGQGDRWKLSLNVPFVFQQNGQITRSGDLFTSMGGSGSGHHHNQPAEVDETISSNYEYGLGDIFFYGNIKMFGKTYNTSGIFFNTQIKFPLASFEKGLGTGEYDYGLSLAIRRSLNTFIFFSDVGFLIIGDPEDFSYNDPITLGVGVGKSFLNGRYNTVMYYQQYSKIIDDYEPPRQISLGINYKIIQGLIIGLTGLAGFSEISPDVGLSGSIQWAIN